MSHLLPADKEFEQGSEEDEINMVITTIRKKPNKFITLMTYYLVSDLNVTTIIISYKRK